MTTARIRVDHVTRVEGHGNIVVNVTDGVVEKCEWQVPEAPRFFESMVRGRHYPRWRASPAGSAASARSATRLPPSRLRRTHSASFAASRAGSSAS